ncbi:mRNA-decapping enzyme 1B isoform X1 [Bufo bufo]|uniref:mRNA-decapping enzyme 1B isoform X1 n=2 Tax=Bufo bufo TaxID=8384 RepID=UPI001ABE42B6|nr:mRNA-decapping enzyme 1B isoform X1 [Bufo bufo]
MAAPGSGPLGRGLDISLAALRRHDPYIQGIVDVASQVALYTFSHKANEWEKTDVEGTLFVYTRSASPNHGFTIMNRLSIENRTEPITKDLEFQLQDPFLLYRNARFLIYGIWFYSKEECQRIAELMKNLTQQEQLKAQQSAIVGVSPMNIHSDGKEVDILQMLSKAKNEYTKCKPCSEPKMMTSSSAIHTNPNLIKPIAVKPSDTAPQGTTVHQDKSADPEPQHLSLTTLFGKTEKNTVENADQKDSPSVRQTVVRSLSYEEPPTWFTDSCDKQLCPAIQKLMVRGTDLHPVAEVPENQHCYNGANIPPGDVFSSLFLSLEDPTPISGQDHVCGGDYLLQKLQGQHSNIPPLDRGPPAIAQCTSGNVIGNAPLNYYDPSQQNQRTPVSVAPAPLPSQPPLSTGAISPQEFLKNLNLVHQEQQLQMNPKPALAAKFPVVTQGAPKPQWTEKSLGEKNNPLLQVISPQRIPATVSPSLLLSPAVFTQSSASDAKKTPKEPASATANLHFPVSLQSTHSNQSSVLTKSQLQETLLHLIQNDENFLNTIYEAYISVLNRGGAGRKF